MVVSRERGQLRGVSVLHFDVEVEGSNGGRIPRDQTGATINFENGGAMPEDPIMKSQVVRGNLQVYCGGVPVNLLRSSVRGRKFKILELEVPGNGDVFALL